MNMKSALITICLFLTFASLLRVSAETSNPPRTFVLEQIFISDSQNREYVFAFKDNHNSFTNTAYKSLSSPEIKEFVSRLPQGSEIEWMPGCLRTGPSPAHKELKDFQVFCKSKGVDFKIYHAG